MKFNPGVLLGMFLSSYPLVAQSSLLRPLDSATVWEGVRVRTGQVFEKQNVAPDFKIKNKSKRKALVAALEGQFQVNVGNSEIKSLKRAGDLSAYIFRAQHGVVFFSKSNFQGKIERIATDRANCDDNFDCLNFIGSAMVPKGVKMTLYDQPKFKGEQLVVDATEAEIRVSSFLKIAYSERVSTTNKAVNWREAVRSVRIQMPKQ